MEFGIQNKDTADRAKARLQARIEEGKKQMAATLKKIEQHIPSDFLVPCKKAEFEVKEGRVRIGWDIDNEVESIGAPNSWNESYINVHQHALGQLYEKSQIPKVYADRLLTEDPELLVTNLEQRYGKQEGKKYLARVVGDKLLGWLSDSYGRYDAQPMVESFLMECKRFDAVPVEARHLETRVYLKMLLPRIFEPIPNEVLAFGARISTSDFGDGALDVRLFIERVMCSNGAMGEEMFRKIHLGAKLTAENFSTDTLEKQASMLASAARDVVHNIFDENHLRARLEMVKQAHDRMIPVKDTLEAMRRNSKITKAEVARIIEMLSVSDVQLLPPVATLPQKGETSAYRLANAFGLLAHDEDTDGYRAMDLEQIAGEIMGIVKNNKVKKEEVEEAEVASV
jgi:hypothetical protein